MKTMKSFKFLTVALAALTFASCSKDDGIDNSDLAAKADVTISLVGQETKAAGAGDATSESKVTDFIAFAFDRDGVLKMTTAAAGESLTATFTGVSTTATEVYVVANTGATVDAPGLFQGVTSLATLKAVAGDLGSGTSTQTKTNLYMHGKGAITYPVGGGNGTATVKLGFSAAKIELTVTDERTTTTTYTYSAHKVSILHAGAHANFFADVPSAQSVFYTGLDDTAYPTPVVATLQAYLNDDVADATAAGTYHYYVFGNNTNVYTDPAKSPTIITVSSLRTKVADGTEERVFYPVHFSATEQVTGEAMAPITPGNSYAITIKLTDTGSGVIDPEVPAVNVDIVVTVETAAWNVLTSGKDF